MSDIKQYEILYRPTDKSLAMLKGVVSATSMWSVYRAIGELTGNMVSSETPNVIAIKKHYVVWRVKHEVTLS
jgi:hypothetical protein